MSPKGCPGKLELDTISMNMTPIIFTAQKSEAFLPKRFNYRTQQIDRTEQDSWTVGVW